MKHPQNPLLHKVTPSRRVDSRSALLALPGTVSDGTSVAFCPYVGPGSSQRWHVSVLEKGTLVRCPGIYTREEVREKFGL